MSTSQSIWPAERLRVDERVQMAGLWLLVVSLSWAYCEACRLTHGASSIDLSYTGGWVVETWSGWLLLSFPAYQLLKRWRNVGVSRARAIMAMVALSFLALCCEWMLNVVISDSGAIERWPSVMAMFNRRALLCVMVSGAIVWFATRPQLIWRRAIDEVPGAEVASPPADPVANKKDDFVVMDRGHSVSISLDDVEAILAAENYVQICLTTGKQYLHRMTLASIERQLDMTTMRRVHRSAIVNVNKVVSRLPGWRVQLTSGREIRIGRTYRDALDQQESL